MIVTRRRFFAGSAAITVAGAAVSKFALPRLLPAPGKSAMPSAWTLGLLGKDGREIDCPGYKRLPLDTVEREGFVDLMPVDGRHSVAWTFQRYVYLSAYAVFMPGIDRPVSVGRNHFPQEIAGGCTLTLQLERDGYVMRLG